MAWHCSVGAAYRLLKGELSCDWAGTPHVQERSGSANKEAKRKVQLVPTESSCSGRIENGITKGLRDPSHATVKQGVVNNRKFEFESPVREAGQGLDSLELKV